MLRKQPRRLIEVLVDDRRAAGPLAELVLELQASGVPVRMVSRPLLERLAPGERHQGVVAHVRGFTYSPVEQFARHPQACVLVLDGVEDPRNLGAAARAAFALGATGLAIPRHRAAAITPVAERVAAGALASLPVAQVTNLARSLASLREGGVWIVGAEADAAVSPWEVDLTLPVALVVGGEDRGLRRLVRKQCDFVVSIPMQEPDLSLNAADAACVMMYEVRRQRAGAALRQRSNPA